MAGESRWPSSLTHAWRGWRWSVAGNARARRFYERNGWTDEGRFDYPAAGDTGPIPVPAHRYIKPVPG